MRETETEKCQRNLSNCQMIDIPHITLRVNIPTQRFQENYITKSARGYIHVLREFVLGVYPRAPNDENHNFFKDKILR